MPRLLHLVSAGALLLGSLASMVIAQTPNLRRELAAGENAPVPGIVLQTVPFSPAPRAPPTLPPDFGAPPHPPNTDNIPANPPAAATPSLPPPLPGGGPITTAPPFPTTTTPPPPAPAAIPAPPPGPGSETFRTPRFDNVRVDWCGAYDTRVGGTENPAGFLECGKPAADRFCKSVGYDFASKCEKEHTTEPTIYITQGVPNPNPTHDTFTYIMCTK